MRYRLVHAICCLAGSASYLDDIRADLRDRGISRAVRDHDTPVLFDWLVEALSFQGISDAVAAGYMARSTAASAGRTLPKRCRETHRARSSAGTGGSTTADTTRGPTRVPSPGTSTLAPCPATRCATATSTRWRTACSCSCGTSPMTISSAGLIGNWVRWIPNLLIGSPALREAIIGPLRNVYGVADKVLAMALSSLLLGAGKRRPLWRRSRRDASWRSTPWSIISCTEPGSCGGCAPTILTETGATGREGAPAFSVCSRRTLMLASSIRPSRRRFRGSCRARSGGIAPGTASTFATAIASTTTPVATTGIANCFAAVIA